MVVVVVVVVAVVLVIICTTCSSLFKEVLVVWIWYGSMSYNCFYIILIVDHKAVYEPGIGQFEQASGGGNSWR